MEGKSERMLFRKDSILVQSGREGQELTAGSAAGKAVGVFTSGGDSQGKKSNYIFLSLTVVISFFEQVKSTSYS